MASIIYVIAYRLEKQPQKTALSPQGKDCKELGCLDVNLSRSGPVSIFPYNEVSHELGESKC